MCGVDDHTVLELCIREDRIIVTANAADFRNLVSGVELHPGLIILPSANRATNIELMTSVITHLIANPDPANYMVNLVIEIDKDGNITEHGLP